MSCAGAEAFIVCREDIAKSLNLPSVRILSTIERHNAFPNDPMQVRGGWELDIGELWSMAELKPSDVDFVETYDDYPVISMMQFEDLGFCAKGDGPDFVRSHTLTNDGTIPHNTSGGQLSVGQGVSWARRGHAPAHLATAWLAGAQCQCLPSFGIRHDQLRSRPVILRCRS
jgi:acetyl-CoA acetyltransferase